MRAGGLGYTLGLPPAGRPRPATRPASVARMHSAHLPSRRDLVRAGSLGVFGLGLSSLLDSPVVAAAPPKRAMATEPPLSCSGVFISGRVINW